MFKGGKKKSIEQNVKGLFLDSQFYFTDLSSCWYHTVLITVAFL